MQRGAGQGPAFFDGALFLELEGRPGLLDDVRCGRHPPQRIGVVLGA